MPIDRKSLPKDPEILQQMLVDLTGQLEKTQKLLRQLLEAKHQTKSEQLSADQLQLFIDELKRTKGDEKDDGDPPPSAGAGQTESKPDSRTRGRQPLAPHLKRQRVEHDLRAEEKHCDTCQQDLHLLGEETSERYEYIPAQFLVIEDVCKKYACACTVRTASKPPQPIAKSSAGASLLAQLIVSKIADHVPLHRQGKIFARRGVEIADQTMGGWMRQSADLLLPLYQRLKAFVLSSRVTGTDDTPVRVLDKSLPGTTRKGRFWPYVGDGNHKAVVFDYTPTRERAGPEKFLKDYRGYLQADAYVAYDSFFTEPKRGLVEVALGAHQAAFSSSVGERFGAYGRGARLHCEVICGGKTARLAGVVGDELRLLRQQGAVPVRR